MARRRRNGKSCRADETSRNPYIRQEVQRCKRRKCNAASSFDMLAASSVDHDSHDDDLFSPPLGPAAAHPARQLRSGTELGVKRALSFPPPSTPPCSPKLNLSAVETPMPKQQRTSAPNAPLRNPLLSCCCRRAPASARHGSSGRVAPLPTTWAPASRYSR